MDAALARLMEQSTPPLNREVADGLARIHLLRVEEQIDKQIRSVARYFPSDLVYEGFRRCTPLEEYRELTRRRTVNNTNKCTFNLARSDTYMVAYKFRFKGEEIIRYISLPFINNEGTINIDGVRFVISPVMCDKIISIGVKNIFVKLNLGKLTFESDPQFYLANNNREMVQLVHSSVYNRTAKNKKLHKVVKAKTTMTHYLFCRYGFTETMRRFAGCSPVLGYDEINPSNYPESDWVICEPVGIKPKTLTTPKEIVYVPSKVKMAIRKEEYTPKAKSHIVAFFYLVEHWPERIKVEWVDEVSMWKTFLGELIWGSTAPAGRLVADAEKHLESLDNYIDAIMRNKFADIGMPIENLYELFGIVVENFNDWILNGNQSISSVYGKQLDVLYYVLSDVSAGINNFYFRLTNTLNKKGDIDIKEIRNLFNATIKTGMIYRLKSTGQHIEVSTIDASSDNRAFKTTALVIPQETTGGGSENVSSDDPSKHLHVSVAEVNVYSSYNKKDPSGHNRINPHVQIDEQGNIVRKEKFKDLLDDVQQYLNRGV